MAATCRSSAATAASSSRASARWPADSNGTTRYRRPAPAQCRQHFAAQIVAIESQLRVRGIADPVQTRTACPGMHLLARELQQWTQVPACREGFAVGHRRQAAHTRAAHQCQQHRFQLVVSVVRREQRFAWLQMTSQDFVASRARSRFDAFRQVWIEIDSFGREFDPQRGACALAMSTPLRRCGLQLVIDMDRTYPPLRLRAYDLRHRMQQRRGVEAAAEGHTELPDSPARAGNG